MDADGQPYPAGWPPVPHGGKVPTLCSYNILYGHDFITTGTLHRLIRSSTADDGRRLEIGKIRRIPTSRY